MAYIGLAEPIIARYQKDGTYAGGVKMGKAVKVEISPEYEDISEYTDINDTEEEKEFAYADISLGIDSLPEEAEMLIFEHEKENGEVIYRDTDRSRYVGVGFRVREKISGSNRYIAIWLHKAKFTELGGGLQVLVAGTTPEELRKLFTDPIKTAKMTVTERGQVLGEYENYTEFYRTEEYTGKLYGIVVNKVGESAEERLASAEQTIEQTNTDMQMAIAELTMLIASMQGGGTSV